MDRHDCIAGLFPSHDSIGVRGCYEDKRAPGGRRSRGKKRQRKSVPWASDPRACRFQPGVQNDLSVTVEKQVSGAEIDHDPVRRVIEVHRSTPYPSGRAVRPRGKSHLEIAGGRGNDWKEDRGDPYQVEAIDGIREPPGEAEGGRLRDQRCDEPGRRRDGWCAGDVCDARRRARCDRWRSGVSPITAAIEGTDHEVRRPRPSPGELAMPGSTASPQQIRRMVAVSAIRLSGLVSGPLTRTSRLMHSLRSRMLRSGRS